MCCLENTECVASYTVETQGTVNHFCGAGAYIARDKTPAGDYTPAPTV
jgi:hypothetical protein